MEILATLTLATMQEAPALQLVLLIIPVPLATQVLETIQILVTLSTMKLSLTPHNQLYTTTKLLIRTPMIRLK